MNASTTKTNADPLNTAERAAVNAGPQLLITIWTLTVISATFLGLRLFSKIRRNRRLRWDDHVLVAGWVSHAALWRWGDRGPPKLLVS